MRVRFSLTSAVGEEGVTPVKQRCDIGKSWVCESRESRRRDAPEFSSSLSEAGR